MEHARHSLFHKARKMIAVASFQETATDSEGAEY